MTAVDSRNAYWRNCLIYNWRRITGQLRQFPEVKGMSYKRYYNTYIKR